MEGGEQPIGGEKLVWQRVSPKHDFVDLSRGAGGADNCAGYAWTEIESSAETDAWLGIGSDDGLQVWVNGPLVANSWVVRPSRLDDDVVPFRLKPGKNQILVKVQNETAAWSLRVRERWSGCLAEVAESSPFAEAQAHRCFSCRVKISAVAPSPVDVV